MITVSANHLKKRVGVIPSEELQQKHRTLKENERFRSTNRKLVKAGNEVFSFFSLKTINVNIFTAFSNLLYH